ncbi:hypothetical protein FRACA_1420014 [Frankia canadensis]|uniref:Uncharacterized protein n=1 Tax=Frankia canadensis TaxID=1836972 RepID=A0A2I2KLI2_9ACTN|nr:hypothetical protein FRACA_1420014 [Frankia canadensis]SOU53803.1 hypothetical protein FRACA_1420014 [Frankia canadensis]
MTSMEQQKKIQVKKNDRYLGTLLG